MGYRFETDSAGEYVLLRFIDSNNIVLITLTFNNEEAHDFIEHLNGHKYAPLELYPYTIAVMHESIHKVIVIGDPGILFKIALSYKQTLDLIATIEITLSAIEFEKSEENYKKPLDDTMNKSWEDKEREAFGGEEFGDRDEGDWWKKPRT